MLKNIILILCSLLSCLSLAQASDFIDDDYNDANDFPYFEPFKRSLDCAASYPSLLPRSFDANLPDIKGYTDVEETAQKKGIRFDQKIIFQIPHNGLNWKIHEKGSIYYGVVSNERCLTEKPRLHLFYKQFTQDFSIESFLQEKFISGEITWIGEFIISFDRNCLNDFSQEERINLLSKSLQRSYDYLYSMVENDRIYRITIDFKSLKIQEGQIPGPITNIHWLKVLFYPQLIDFAYKMSICRIIGDC